MAKIVITTIFILFFQSCIENKKYSYNEFISEKYNVIISGSIFSIEYDLNSNTINSNLISQKLIDTLILKKSEKNTLVNLLYNNGFLKRKGEYTLIGKNLISPPNDDKISVYKNGKLISTYLINRNFESESFFPSSEEKEIVEFREYIINLLSIKKEYILMNKRARKILEKTGTYTL